jgi:putative sterol carrier protein
MPVKEILQNTIDRFHKKVECDPKLREELIGIKKTVNIDLGCETYHFTLEDAHIKCLCDGLLDCSDLAITSDAQTVEDLYNGKVKIMKAYALRKIRIKGSMEDVMRLRKLF